MAFRPSKEQIRAAEGKGVPDVIRPNLQVLFCGINPGLYSAAVGHHFSRPGNRFWPTLYRSGFTHRQLSPFEERDLLEMGLGITNLINRATATADGVTKDELVRGAQRLKRKVARFRPRFVAIVGLGAYRTGFRRLGARGGRQEERLGEAILWVLPNPSGLNAHYQLPDLVRLYAGLRKAVARTCARK